MSILYNIFYFMIVLQYIVASVIYEPAIHTLNNGNVGPEFKTVDSIGSKENQTEDAEFWYTSALRQLGKTIKNSEKNDDYAFLKKAKNIIIFVGDGMGLSSVTMGRIYKGQYLKNGNGEEEELSFETFPHTGIVKTYNVDRQVPDSAGTATAMFCGAKTNFLTLGMDATRSRTDAEKGSLSSIMDWAQEENKRTGIVTTTRITHATPAATYARVYQRTWECDSQIPDESKPHYIDIARQLVERLPGRNFNVILGGGLRPMGAPVVNGSQNTQSDIRVDSSCNRTDNLNLVAKWLEINPEQRVFVQTKQELLNLDLNKTDQLMGLFRNSHLSFGIERENDEPSLKEMTEAAIDVLERGESSEGFVLMVESGRIDHGHHQNFARAALHDVYELDLAVQAALDKTNSKDTLIIVTADHSHAVTMNGYPSRGNDILGFSNWPNPNVTYETISYANGPGHNNHLANNTEASTVWRPLNNFTAEERSSPTYRHLAAVPLDVETHGGEDVVAFACGPGSSLVRGVFEQNYLAFVMSYAGCMGPAKYYDGTCQTYETSAFTSGAHQVTKAVSNFLLLIGGLFYYKF